MSNSTSSIAEQIKKIIAEQLMKKPEEITPDAELDSLNIQSLEFAELLMEIHTEFNVEIPDEDAETIRTVQDLIDYIEQNQQK